MRALITAVLVAAALTAGCGSDNDSSSAEDLPSYDSTVIEPDQLIVRTDETDPDQLRHVFDQVRDDQSGGDAWYVTISCASIAASPPENMGRVLATGQFANSNLGLAQSGLSSTDDVVFELEGQDPAPVTPPADIPPEPPPLTADAHH